jgi:hypothetical protein
MQTTFITIDEINGFSRVELKLPSGLDKHERLDYARKALGLEEWQQLHTLADVIDGIKHLIEG